MATKKEAAKKISTAKATKKEPVNSERSLFSVSYTEDSEGSCVVKVDCCKYNKMIKSNRTPPSDNLIAELVKEYLTELSVSY